MSVLFTLFFERRFNASSSDALRPCDQSTELRPEVGNDDYHEHKCAQWPCQGTDDRCREFFPPHIVSVRGVTGELRHISGCTAATSCEACCADCARATSCVLESRLARLPRLCPRRTVISPVSLGLDTRYRTWTVPRCLRPGECRKVSALHAYGFLRSLAAFCDR